jgi:hypothetical protein
LELEPQGATTLIANIGSGSNLFVLVKNWATSTTVKILNFQKNPAF